MHSNQFHFKQEIIEDVEMNGRTVLRLYVNVDYNEHSRDRWNFEFNQSFV